MLMHILQQRHSEQAGLHRRPRTTVLAFGAARERAENRAAQDFALLAPRPSSPKYAVGACFSWYGRCPIYPHIPMLSFCTDARAISSSVYRAQVRARRLCPASSCRQGLSAEFAGVCTPSILGGTLRGVLVLGVGKGFFQEYGGTFSGTSAGDSLLWGRRDSLQASLGAIQAPKASGRDTGRVECL